MRFTAILSLLAVLSLSGCAHSSATSAADASAVARKLAAARAVVLCQTTEADLRRELGEPTRDGLLRDHRIMSWIIGGSDPVKYLAVMLDGRGVVVDRYWDIPTEIPWTPENQCAARP